MVRMSYGVKLKVWGEYACFTRPEAKAERVSYDAMTPSAARAVLSAIYWKPEIKWIIDRIHVLNEIKFMNIRRNEIEKKGPANILADRTQRFTMALRDVAYAIEAHFEIVRGDDNPGKHIDIFNRRAADGQTFFQPYLGTREFPANFELCENSAGGFYEKVPERDLGIMLYDIDFDNGKSPMFFRAIMRYGAIDTSPKGIIR
jgi:CRISPR-associated protein Cas5d